MRAPSKRVVLFYNNILIDYIMVAAEQSVSEAGPPSDLLHNRPVWHSYVS